MTDRVAAAATEIGNIIASRALDRSIRVPTEAAGTVTGAPWELGRT